MAEGHQKPDQSSIPTGASDWKKNTLDALNAHYERRDVFDFNFDNSTIPSNLQEGRPSKLLIALNFCADIENLAREFERVNDSNTINPEFEFDADDHPTLVHFVPFYRQLSQIVSKKSAQNPPLATSSSEITPPIRTTLPSARLQTPPPRAIDPVNPQYSSTSTASTSSRESKPEHFTHAFANNFISASLESLKKSIEHIAWYRSANYRIRHWYPQ